MWSIEHSVPHGRQIPIALVVGHDENDVWPLVAKGDGVGDKNERKKDLLNSHRNVLVGMLRNLREEKQSRNSFPRITRIF
jgi:hypothetical protein